MRLSLYKRMPDTGRSRFRPLYRLTKNELRTQRGVITLYTDSWKIIITARIGHPVVVARARSRHAPKFIPPLKAA